MSQDTFKYFIINALCSKANQLGIVLRQMMKIIFLDCGYSGKKTGKYQLCAVFHLIAIISFFREKKSNLFKITIQGNDFFFLWPKRSGMYYSQRGKSTECYQKETKYRSRYSEYNTILLCITVPCKKILHHKSTRPIQNQGTCFIYFGN